MQMIGIEVEETHQGQTLDQEVQQIFVLRTGLQKVASGASAASGHTQISWPNLAQNHVYFVQALCGNCGKRYLSQTKGVLDNIFST